MEPPPLKLEWGRGRFAGDGISQGTSIQMDSKEPGKQGDSPPWGQEALSPGTETSQSPLPPALGLRLSPRSEKAGSCVQTQMPPTLPSPAPMAGQRHQRLFERLCSSSQAVYPLPGAALNQILTSRLRLPLVHTTVGLPEAGEGLASQDSSPVPSEKPRKHHTSAWKLLPRVWSPLGSRQARLHFHHFPQI